MKLLLGLILAGSLLAQDRTVTHNLHGWFNYFGDHPFGESKWGVHLEGQWRRHDVVTKWQQLLLRPGVNYEVNRYLMLTAGYAFIRSFPYGELPSGPRNDEHRLWQQAWLRYRTGRVGWTTRLRFENRFLETSDPVTGVRGHRYENRFRGWQQFRVNLSKKNYVTGYNEIWFYVPPYVSNSVFDQNRAYGALGFQMHPDWRFEVGYLNQTLLRRTGTVLESNHTLMFQILSHARFRKR